MTKFLKIQEEYKRRRIKLLAKGQFQRATSHGYWASSNPDHIYELFKKINLKNYKSFVDLGSGDGIVCAIASCFTKSTGIEVDELLHNDATKIKMKLNLNSKFINKDFTEVDLKDFNIIFMNPDNYFYKLEKKLIDEFKGTLILTSNIFSPLTLNPSESVFIRGTKFDIYKLR